MKVKSNGVILVFFLFRNSIFTVWKALENKKGEWCDQAPFPPQKEIALWYIQSKLKISEHAYSVNRK